MRKTMIKAVGLICLIGMITPLLSAQQLPPDIQKPLAQYNSVGDNYIVERNSSAFKNLQQVIELKLDKASVEQALVAIARKADLKLMYSKTSLPGDKQITLHKPSITVNDALWSVLEGTGLRFALSQNRQLILLKMLQENRKVLQEVVTGQVTDASTGETLPGVNIIVKGTTIGTSTNRNGRYKLTVPSLNDTLVFSFVGYQTREVPINGRTDLNVELRLQAVSGEEIVVVGYGSVEEQNLTGSVSSVNVDELSSRPLTSSSSALQGQAPGLYALQTSGRAGGDEAILRIRGVGTLNNSDPLVVIDGVPGEIDDVDPRDIESVSVLKDAASASIYGSRAANGVILVTTKTGSSNNEVQLSYNGQFGWQQPTSLPDVLNAVEYVTLANEAQRNSGQPPAFSEEEVEKFHAGNDPMFPDNDMFDVMYDEFEPIQNHHLGLILVGCTSLAGI